MLGINTLLNLNNAFFDVNEKKENDRPGGLRVPTDHINLASAEGYFLYSLRAI
jgi:hypothetical protein